MTGGYKHTLRVYTMCETGNYVCGIVSVSASLEVIIKYHYFIKFY